MVISRNNTEKRLTYEDLEKYKEELGVMNYQRVKIKTGVLLYSKLRSLPSSKISDVLFPAELKLPNHFQCCGIEVELDTTLPPDAWEAVTQTWKEPS